MSSLPFHNQSTRRTTASFRLHGPLALASAILFTLLCSGSFGVTSTYGQVEPVFDPTDVGDGRISSGVEYDGRLFFAGLNSSPATLNDPVDDNELWAYSPSKGLHFVVDVIPDPNENDDFPVGNSLRITNLTLYAGKLYFGTQATTGQMFDLMSYDAVTDRVAVVAQGVRPVGEFRKGFTVYDEKLFFQGSGDGAGGELWAYDVRTRAATRIADINAGAEGSKPQELTVFNGKLYFEAIDDQHGNQVHVYDSATGTVDHISNLPYAEDFSGISDLIVYNDALYYSAEAYDTGGSIKEGLWMYDESGPPVLAYDDKYLGDDRINGISLPDDLIVYDDRLFFRMRARRDGVTDIELYAYDATTGEGALIPEVNTSTSSFPSSSPNWMTVYDGKLYFSAKSIRNSLADT